MTPKRRVSVTLPNGLVESRTTERDYRWAVAVRYDRMPEWHVYRWSGTYENATKAASYIKGRDGKRNCSMKNIETSILPIISER